MNDAILFTAFEPSGDAHAAPVIQRLRMMQPELAIYAYGGPKMAAAGAIMVEETARDGAMGLNALGRITAVRRTIAGIRRWTKKYRVVAHVAVDSPAANFPICKHMRKNGVRVVHLVAPQLWAWGSWRTAKLRRRTDLVLCLLPFEEAWFRDRKIPARFIGHPRINRELDEVALDQTGAGFPGGSPKIALLPGSRTHEVKANLPLLLRVFTELQSRDTGTTGLIAAATPEIATLIRDRMPVLPTGSHIVVGESDATIRWADLCLAVSGTVTLDIARQHTPMVGVYRTWPHTAIIARLMLRTPYRLLPNIIAEREIVPEFVPWAGGAGPILDAARELLIDSRRLVRQQADLQAMCRQYSTKAPDLAAARLILEAVDGKVFK